MRYYTARTITLKILIAEMKCTTINIGSKIKEGGIISKKIVNISNEEVIIEKILEHLEKNYSY